MIIQDPLRLKIIKALTAKFKTITPANGYQMDLADEAGGVSRVVRGKLFLGDDDPRFIVSILEPPSAVEAVKSGPDNTSRANEWDILIQGWAHDDADNEPCDLAYALAADVTRCLALEKKGLQTGRPGATNILNMGPRLTEIRIGTPVVRPTENVSEYGVFYIILTLKIIEDMANPFG